MLLVRKVPDRRAGASAMRRFDAGQRKWKRLILRRTWWWVPLSLVPYIAATQTAGAFSTAMSFSSGAMIAAWIILRESPPERIEHWRSGGEGERSTARQLRKLRSSGWRDFHDLGLGGDANVDHVVVRGTDVLILDTKNWGGTATVDAEGVHMARLNDDNPRRPYQPAWQVRAAATELAKVIHGQSGVQPWVHPVIVLWSKFPQRLVQIEGVTYVHGKHLVEWLSTRPHTRSMPVTEAKILAAVEAIEPYQQLSERSADGTE